jgi:hypothetical protein
MVFKVAPTFHNPGQSQSGFATPGAGAQTVGIHTPAPESISYQDWKPERDQQGFFSWIGDTLAAAFQRGFPSPQDALQRRPVGSMPNHPTPDGLNHEVYTPYFSRGAAAYVQNYGKVFTNPIGAGVVAMYRPQASYGPAGQYENGAIWWTSQDIPTSINPSGLVDPQELAALLGSLQVQAVVRTTG